MSSATSTEPAPAVRSLPGWTRWAAPLGALVLWAALLVFVLRARLGLSTAVLFACGAAALWTARWLYRTLSALADDAPPTERGRQSGARRRELEREKRILLRAIKELEFDHAMGKLSDADYADIAGRYRARAVRVLRQLDEGERSYREIIERELARRLARGAPQAGGSRSCPRCSVPNDPDAVFCKRCGTRLAAEAEEVSP